MTDAPYDDTLDEVLLDLLERTGSDGCREDRLTAGEMSRADVHRWVDRALARGHIERNLDGGPPRYRLTLRGGNYRDRLSMLNRGLPIDHRQDAA